MDHARIKTELHTPELVISGGDYDHAATLWPQRMAPLYPSDFITICTRSFPHSQIELTFPKAPGFKHVSVNMTCPSLGLREGKFAFRPEDKTILIQTVTFTGQGRGLGTLWLRNLAELAEKSGINKFRLSAQKVGGYAWAKLGFVPTPASWKDLRGAVMSRLDTYRDMVSGDDYRKISRLCSSSTPKHLLVLADLEEPRVKPPKFLEGLAVPDEEGLISIGQMLLLGQRWGGVLDFNDRDSKERFFAYVKTREQSYAQAVASSVASSKKSVS